MNNESPLIPQGSLLEQKHKGRSRVRIAVFLVLVLHGCGLLAFLLLGCNHNDTTEKQATNAVPIAAQPAEPPATNATPAFETTNPAAAETTNPVATPAVAPPPASNPTPAVVETATPAAPPASAAGDYKIAKGDTLGKIARKSHVSVKALMEANPGVDSTKLRIGQVIHLPAAASAGSGTGATTAGTAGSGGGAAATEQTYTVKSGDSLTKIAGQFGVKVKALRAANSLRTDKIKVGQKLKIPEKSASAATAATSATDLVPTPAGGSTTAPPTTAAGR